MDIGDRLGFQLQGLVGLERDEDAVADAAAFEDELGGRQLNDLSFI